MRVFWLAVLIGCVGCSPGTDGAACTEGGARDCDGEVTLMCLCDGDDPFAETCDEGGTWTVQDTLCESCADWLTDSCPIE